MFLAPVHPLAGRVVSVTPGPNASRFTVYQMRSMVERFKKNPDLINAVTSLIYTQRPTDWVGEINTIFEFVRDGIKYQLDPFNLETLSTPLVTIQRKVGDCDDKSTLLATLLEIAGHATRFVIAGYDETKQFQHVYNQVLIDNKWVNADSTEIHGLGYAPPFPTVIEFERI